MLSASFILYFKRGDPINFLLSMGTTFFGNVVFPVQAPSPRGAVGLGLAADELVARGRPGRAPPRRVVCARSPGRSRRLAILTAILVPAGLLGARIAIRKAKREGTLVQY